MEALQEGTTMVRVRDCQHEFCRDCLVEVSSTIISSSRHFPPLPFPDHEDGNILTFVDTVVKRDQGDGDANILPHVSGQTGLLRDQQVRDLATADRLGRRDVLPVAGSGGSPGEESGMGGIIACCFFLGLYLISSF